MPGLSSDAHDRDHAAGHWRDGHGTALSVKPHPIALGVWLLSTPAVFAGGLSTTMGEVTLDQLPRGVASSLQEAGGMEYQVLNTSEEALELQMDILPPTPDELKEGYEALPDPAWVTLERETFSVLPQMPAATDVRIAVPDEAAHAGRRYQFWIWTHTVGRSLGVGLKSRFLITIADDRP